ncbi:transmembrane protein, putative (macronuclear) [Tetrahymena thermophila SB210]|uniref:Transmembrane protein, putative n=1 Tax=Tetrahymena thermophila (strain SB210) TaxID=312017 RepID=W7XH93_TETTS|nr:transmembrane protein, putative [Tetrahymena thermophila SB210]EWS76558.1 transmembrane protein, putative [Tetrahymena thermophila SB210]|eukprot:XP_012650930.1 transmembrane protein, putative [Tetrahymena thermophila SB210]
MNSNLIYIQLIKFYIQNINLQNYIQIIKLFQILIYLSNLLFQELFQNFLIRVQITNSFNLFICFLFVYFYSSWVFFLFVNFTYFLFSTFTFIINQFITNNFIFFLIYSFQLSINSLFFLCYLKSQNQIGGTGASGLGFGLLKCPNLSNLKLGLRENQICDYGSSDLVSSLVKCIHLSNLTLSLENNNINKPQQLKENSKCLKSKRLVDYKINF